MGRSKWKGPYTTPVLINKLNNKKITRNSEIIPSFVGQSFEVYSGNLYVSVIVTEEMIGHKFGEFVFTRKRNLFKKIKNKK